MFKRKKYKTFICEHCGSGNHLYLLESGACPKCYFGATNQANIKPGPKKHTQSVNTIQMRLQIMALIRTTDWTIYKLAQAWGTNNTSIYRWINGQAGEETQEKFNNLAKRALEGEFVCHD